MNEQEKQKENKQLGMKWFNFYFSWRIYISLVFSVFGLIFSASLIFSELNLFLGSAVLFDLLNIVLVTILLIGFRKKRAWLYRYNVFVLILEGFNISSRSFGPEDTALIWFGVGFLWFFFNYKYFRKRKSFMFYVAKEKPPRKFFQFITINLKSFYWWLKKYSKWIIIVLLVGLVIYWIIPKYYFIKDGSRLLKCNKITGSCERIRY